jgi:beta-galactosidase
MSAPRSRRNGSPAVTRHGNAWYVSTSLDEVGRARLLGEMTVAAGVLPAHAGLPAGVEVVRRGALLFIVNHTPASCEVAAAGVDLVSGARIADRVRVPARSFAVLAGWEEDFVGTLA